MADSITITLLFVNSIRQDVTINNTFIQVNNLPYNDISEVRIADIIGFLITNWQPKWGQKPLNIAQLRFIQLGRSLRTALSLGDLNLAKSSVFHVNLRPVSIKDSTNRRASLLVPTSHNKRTTRVFSNNGQPMTVNTTDDINFSMNQNGTTTVVGNETDISTYYNDRYGLNMVGNRQSYNIPGNRASYFSSNRNRQSFMEAPTTTGSSQSYSINRSYGRRYSDETTEEDEEDIDLESDEIDQQLGTLQNNNQQEFHHIITTNKGKREQEARLQAAADNASVNARTQQRKSQPPPSSSQGSCCIIM